MNEIFPGEHYKNHAIFCNVPYILVIFCYVPNAL